MQPVQWFRRTIEFGWVQRVGVFALLAMLLVGLASPASGATEAPVEDEGAGEDTEATEPTDEELAFAELLREGSAVYTQICASCHQAGGVGLTGQYPPLLGNPRVDDADYVEGVITNGRQGELEVAGVVYDSVMPSFSTLSDDDTAAVIAFIQNGFVAPATEVAAPALGPVAGTELPALSNLGYVLTFLITAGLVGLVLEPRITSANSRLDFPWLDAALRTTVIVASIVVLTVIIPDWAIRNDAVTDLSRFAQELIAVSLWIVGLGAVLWGLWYAHRKERI